MPFILKTNLAYVLKTDDWKLLQIHAEQTCRKHPDLKDEITEMLQLALDEIEQGESLHNEIEIAHQAITDLILDIDEATDEN